MHLNDFEKVKELVELYKNHFGYCIWKPKEKKIVFGRSILAYVSDLKFEISLENEKELWKSRILSMIDEIENDVSYSNISNTDKKKILKAIKIAKTDNFDNILRYGPSTLGSVKGISDLVGGIKLSSVTSQKYKEIFNKAFKKLDEKAIELVEIKLNEFGIKVK